jgi:hypothetical protein
MQKKNEDHIELLKKLDNEKTLREKNFLLQMKKAMEKSDSEMVLKDKEM